MSEPSLLVVKTESSLTVEQRDRIGASLADIAQSLDLKVVFADAGVDIGIHTDIAPLLRTQIKLQQENNQLLIALIEALDDGGDTGMDDDASTYLNGDPVR